MCDQWPNAVVETLEHFFLVEKYMLVEEYENLEHDVRTQELHTIQTHNRGSVRASK